MKIDTLELDALAADPPSPTEGMKWFNTTEGRYKRYVNGETKSSADLEDVIGNLDGGKADTNYGGITSIDGGSA